MSESTRGRHAADPGHPRPYDFPAFSRASPGQRPRGDRRADGRPAAHERLARSCATARPTIPTPMAGPSSLAARALSEGTERYDAVALVEATERLGAGLHADAGWDAATVSIEVPVERLEPALELLAEIAAHPTFPVREVDRLREERLNDLLQARAEPRRRVDEAFIGTIYGPSSPYHRPAGGVAETVERLDAESARGGLGTRLRPGPDDPDRRRRPGGRWRTAARSRWPSGCSAAGPPRRVAAPAGRSRQPRGRPVTDSIKAPRSAGLGPDRDPRRPRRRRPAGSTTTPA